MLKPSRLFFNPTKLPILILFSFNFNGSGEFAVAIRTALIKSNSLYAYAGCGIVEGSEAKAEFEESEIKLTPILSLFVDEKVYQS